jgi:hypothetical protein
MTINLKSKPPTDPMPPWHLYLKYTAFASLSAFGLWVVEDLWMWLLVAIAVWQATGGKRPI